MLLLVAFVQYLTFQCFTRLLQLHLSIILWHLCYRFFLVLH